MCLRTIVIPPTFATRMRGSHNPGAQKEVQRNPQRDVTMTTFMVKMMAMEMLTNKNKIMNRCLCIKYMYVPKSYC